MVYNLLKLVAVVFALSLSIVYPTVHAQSSSVSGTSAANISDTSSKELTPSGASAGSRKGDPRSNGVGNAPNQANATERTGANRASASAVVSSADEAKAIKNLMAAAQLLRESIQRMAQAPAGERRSQAIAQGNETLLQVNSAVMALPSNLLQAGGSEYDYNRIVIKLKDASDRLYAAVVALAQQPPSTSRNQAIRAVNQALAETNVAMVDGLYLEAGRDGSTKSARAFGSSTNSTSGASDASGSDMRGSALRTGRPPANNVELAPANNGTSASSGSTGITGQNSR